MAHSGCTRVNLFTVALKVQDTLATPAPLVKSKLWVCWSPMWMVIHILRGVHRDCFWRDRVLYSFWVLIAYSLLFILGLNCIGFYVLVSGILVLQVFLLVGVFNCASLLFCDHWRVFQHFYCVSSLFEYNVFRYHKPAVLLSKVFVYFAGLIFCTYVHPGVCMHGVCVYYGV